MRSTHKVERVHRRVIENKLLDAATDDSVAMAILTSDDIRIIASALIDSRSNRAGDRQKQLDLADDLIRLHIAMFGVRPEVDRIPR